jgi:hypothetical protein
LNSSTLLEASPRLDNPATRVFSNQEFAKRIVGIFNGAGEGDRLAIAKLVTLNRTFLQVSTDIIWREVPSLAPFLRLLPTCYDTEEPNDYQARPIIPTVVRD